MAGTWNRRRFLGAMAGAGSAGAVGCLGRFEEGIETGGESTPTPADRTPIETDRDLTVEHPPLEEWAGYDPDWEPPTASPLEVDLQVDVLVENLAIPWDLSFTGEQEVFITERPGRISRYDAAELETITEPTDVIDHAKALDVDDEGGWFAAGGEGGLLGCAAHPRYPDVPVVYAFYTYEDGDETRNRLVHFDLSGSSAEETVVVDDVPGNPNAHNGCRIEFGPRNYLWATMGDAHPNVDEYDPTLSTLNGTVFRLTPDGRAPPDNPDLKGADPLIYSYGHRNPQGIAWLPDGTPAVTEHGPSRHDEVQLLRAGGDYGWPGVRGVPGDDQYTPYAQRDDVVPPLVSTGTSTTWAPSGTVFYRGDAVPEWRNRLLVGGLGSQQVIVVTPYRPDDDPPTTEPDGKRYDGDWTYPDYHAVAHTALTDEIGRIRLLEEGPNGDLYAITSNRDGRAEDPFPVEGDDKLVRIRAA